MSVASAVSPSIAASERRRCGKPRAEDRDVRLIRRRDRVAVVAVPPIAGAAVTLRVR
jgi:hypothetical protein